MLGLFGSAGGLNFISPGPKVVSCFRRKITMETVATFTNLDDADSQVCPVLGLDGRMMQLKLSKRADIGSAVKVETGDTMSLGEVSYCRPEGDGYVVWVQVMQALHDVTELSRLARALLA
jgi:hypothetical protein